MQTAINMGVQEDDNLILVHNVLSAAGSPAQMLSAVQGRARNSARDRVQKAATGCLLAQALDLVGKGSRLPEDKSRYAQFSATCTQVEAMWRATNR
jgi:hypothetical protein